jgi:hypothetical protein
MRRIILAAAFVLVTAFVPGATAAQPAETHARAAAPSTANSTAVGILGSLGAILAAIRATKLAERGLARIQGSR